MGVRVPGEAEADPAEDVGVGAIPRISEMAAADFDDMLFAAMARARCLFTRY